MLREIKSSQRMARVIALKVTGTGTAAINIGSTDATLTDNGTGDYTITYAKPFARTAIPVVVPGTANIIAIVTATSASACTVKTFQGTDGTTATDAIFYVHVVGYDSVDET